MAIKILDGKLWDQALDCGCKTLVTIDYDYENIGRLADGQAKEGERFVILVVTGDDCDRVLKMCGPNGEAGDDNGN